MDRGTIQGSSEHVHAHANPRIGADESSYSAAKRSAGHTTGTCLESVLFTFLLGMIAVFLVGAVTYGPTGAQPGECRVSQEFPHKVLRWCGWITQFADQYDLPPDLVAAVIWQESGGNPSAISTSGAVGLMQVMPRDGRAAEFTCPEGPCFQYRPTTSELLKPRFNIQYGARMLRDLRQSADGDLREALYRYGPIDMGYRYADIVLGLYQEYGSPESLQ